MLRHSDTNDPEIVSSNPDNVTAICVWQPSGQNCLCFLGGRAVILCYTATLANCGCP